jgi:hypothetical protein
MAEGVSTAGSGDQTGRQRIAVVGELISTRKPDAVDELVIQDVPEGVPQGANAIWLTADVRVQRQAIDEGALLRPFDHFVELIGDHVGEFAAAVLTPDKRTGVVEFSW